MTAMIALRREYLPAGEQMIEAQGLRPFDPCRTLQLHVTAPRDLVENAYWLLASSAGSASRVEALNAAYATLIDSEARRAYHDERGVTEAAARPARTRSPFLRLLPAKKPGTSAPQLDHYRLLSVDEEASDQIIRLAYAFWTHGLRGPRLDSGQLAQAYRTLSDPILRAQYDARRAESRRSPKVKITKQVHAQIRIAQHNEITGVEKVPAVSPADGSAGPSDEASGPAPAPVVPIALNGRHVAAVPLASAPAPPPADAPPAEHERIAPAVAAIAPAPAPPPVYVPPAEQEKIAPTVAPPDATGAVQPASSLPDPHSPLRLPVIGHVCKGMRSNCRAA